VSIRDRLRNRSQAEGPGDAGSATREPGDGELPISGYEKLNAKQISDKLHELSQADLVAIEAYEREHGARPAVLDKLRYMRSDEPLKGYDTMSPGEISEALAGAESALVRAVRDYERKFQHRREVLDEAARVLPEAPASAEETRARDAKASAVKRAMRAAPDVP